jgi:hypothetical protein
MNRKLIAVVGSGLLVAVTAGRVRRHPGRRTRATKRLSRLILVGGGPRTGKCRPTGGCHQGPRTR